MKRCLAVMLETLRMFPTVSPGSKATGDSPVPMQIMEGDTLIIPPHTSITPNSPTLQVLPEVWGPDSLTWRPTMTSCEHPSKAPLNRGAMAHEFARGKSLRKWSLSQSFPVSFRATRLKPNRKAMRAPRMPERGCGGLSTKPRAV
ncbi:hypothetical protein BKA80DRAFT_19407 [Phyllosticta citrichinensis]